MKILISFLLLISLFLIPCFGQPKVSREVTVKDIIGYPVRLKRPLRLYEINYQLSGYKNRYLFGANIHDQPLVAIIPAGHIVCFDKIVERSGLNAAGEGLEGSIKFNGKIYPIYFSLGLGDSPENIRKSINFNFLK